jgi:hypothetical protein
MTEQDASTAAKSIINWISNTRRYTLLDQGPIASFCRFDSVPPAKMRAGGFFSVAFAGEEAGENFYSAAA